MPELGPNIKFAIAHRQTGTNNRPWYTTYQAIMLSGDLLYSQAQTALELLIDAEAKLYYNVVTLIGGTASRIFAKTTVPDPAPDPYNPAFHTVATANVVGERVPSGEVMFYDQVIDFMRVASFGNPGHIELRGALTEGEIDHTLATKQLTSAARTAWLARLATFVADLEAIEGLFEDGLVFSLITQPQTSITRFVVDNKWRATRTYGLLTTRKIESWGLGNVRTDKGHAKYFDTSL